MTSAVISVGAGEMQYEFIKRLKEHGLCVVAFGHGRNSEEAISLCDYFKDIDTTDEEAAIEWLDNLSKTNDLNYIGAGSYAGGVAIKTLQIITNKYNLPTRIPNNLITGMDKYTQQIMYKKFGLSDITTIRAVDLYKNSTFIDENETYILKPGITRGSMGIEYINGIEVMNRLRAGKFKDEDVIQNVITGIEYRMLMIVQHGEIQLLAPVKRTNYKDTLFLGRLEIDGSNYSQIRNHASKIVSSLHLTNTIVKYDILVNEEGVNLIEMDVGVGGGFYFKEYISQAFEVNLMDIYIDLILGNEVNSCKKTDSFLVMDYIYNEKDYPIHYDLYHIEEMIEKMVGPFKILINRMHPEKKGGYHSNADFIFTVIHKNKEISTVKLNEYINQFIFKG